jgi:hypothetical protein
MLLPFPSPFSPIHQLLRRRRERTEKFFATIHAFVAEYTALQQDLSSAGKPLDEIRLRAFWEP